MPAAPAPLSAPSQAPRVATLKDVQHALNLLGASPALVEDGVNGPKTIAAVRAFQAQHPALVVDGAAGPQTKAALAAALAHRTTTAGAELDWRLATNADVVRDGVGPRFAEMLAHPVGARSESEIHNGRLWCFQVVSHLTHPHLTTHTKDVVAYLAPPSLGA
jgi:hypothetical protein